TRRRWQQSPGTLRCLAVLAVLPFALEGVVPATSLDRDEWVTATAIVEGPVADVARAVVEPPRFDRPLPAYLRIGFPRPSATRIERGAAGARWLIQIRGGEMRLDGIEPRTGTLILELVEKQSQSMRWHVVSDDSHMTH